MVETEQVAAVKDWARDGFLQMEGLRNGASGNDNMGGGVLFCDS